MRDKIGKSDDENLQQNFFGAARTHLHEFDEFQRDVERDGHHVRVQHREIEKVFDRLHADRARGECGRRVSALSKE